MDHLFPQRDFEKDALLVRQAQHGDRTAFAQLATEYRGIVEATIRRYAAEDAVEDLVQESLVRAWERLPQLKDPQAFPAWLSTLAVNLCKRYSVREARSGQTLDDALCRVQTPGADPLDILLRHEQVQAVRDALLALPPKNRQALILHVWAYYSYAEIAERLGIPLTTVEGRIHRAKAQLRQRLYEGGTQRKRGAPAQGGTPMATPNIAGECPALVPQLGLKLLVESLTVSPGERYLASVARDGMLIIWDLASRQALMRLARAGYPYQLRFSPDSRLLAFSNRQMETTILDITTGEELRTLPTLARNLAFSADGLWTLSWMPNPEKEQWVQPLAVCWDIASGEVTHRVEGLTGSPMNMNLDTGMLVTVEGSPSYDHRVFVALSEVELRVWDFPSGEQRRALHGLQGFPQQVAISPDGARVAASALDAQAPTDLLVWDMETGEISYTLTAHQAKVADIAFSPDGRLLLYTTAGGELYIIDAATGRVQRVLAYSGQLGAIAITSDGREVITAAPTLRGPASFTSGEMVAWDITQGEISHRFTSHTQTVNAVSFHPDGHTLALGGLERAVTCWSLTEGCRSRSLAIPPRHYVSSLAYHPAGTLLLAGVNTIPDTPYQGMEGRIYIWDVQSGKLQHTLTEHSSFVYDIACSAEAHLVASCSYDNSVLIWDDRTWQVMRRYSYGEGWSSHHRLALTTDGSLLAVNGMRITPNRVYAEGALILWHLPSDSVRFRWEDADYGFEAPVFTPDGTMLIAAMKRMGEFLSRQVELRCWDTGTGEVVRRYTADGLYGGVWRVAVSPDGRLIAAVTSFGYILLWQDAQQEPVVILHPLSGFTEVLTFTPDGRKLISGDATGSVMLWDVPRLLRGETTRESATLASIDDGAEWLIYTPEGYYTSSAGAVGYLRWRKGMELQGVDSCKEQCNRPEVIMRALM